jgi:2'-5' RNA ligase
MKGALYFIAVLPNEEISREVTAFKHYAARHFGSSRALNSPAHITLFPPFQWRPERLRELTPVLLEFARKESPFYLSLKNFNCFRPRVIYVDVEPGEELREMQARLEKRLHEKFGLEVKGKHGFNPHMTIAFKDLKKEAFPEAWAHFSKLEYVRIFFVNDLVLLEHRGGKWEIVQRFSLGL